MGCRVDKNGLQLHKEETKLTDSEREVLYMFTEEFLTIKQVSIRRGCSRQAVNKIKLKLIEKGYMNRVYMKVDKMDSTCQPCQPNGVRLHGQEFNIKILHKDHRYTKIKNDRGNTIVIDGSTIRLYRDSIEVYGNKSFMGDDAHKATSKSMKYWQRVFRKLENDLKIILIKQRSQNIRLVNAHYADIKNGMAKDCVKHGDNIRIYANEDGKLWFTIDNSFNLEEAETMHPETGQHDMDKVIKPFMNDLRDNNPPTLSEVMTVINRLAEQNKETAAGLSSIVKYMESQIPKSPVENNRGDYFG